MRSAPPDKHRFPKAINLVSLLLLVTLLTTCFGPVCSFLISQARIRQKMESQIEEIMPDSALVIFYLPEISKGDFCWTRKGREFSYDGEMYDVVRTGYRNGRKVLICLNDRLEKKLMKDFTKRETGRRHPVRNFRSINFSWFDSTKPYICLTPATTFHFMTWSDNFKSEVTEILSPPPEEITITA
jgi:hypothetical protein